MALELNGTTGVSLVQDGVVTAADLASGAITSAALPTGSVLQVINNSNSSQISTTSGTFVETGLSLSITPSSTSSKIVLYFVSNARKTTANTGAVFAIYKDGSQLTNGNGQLMFETDNGNNHGPMVLHQVDSPATTDSITYDIRYYAFNGGTTYMSGNWGGNHLTAMEIAG